VAFLHWSAGFVRAFIFASKREAALKKLAVAVALVVASLSLAGCFVGKGKAPPPPVVTKG
jgi:hypothetical protein